MQPLYLQLHGLFNGTVAVGVMLLEPHQAKSELKAVASWQSSDGIFKQSMGARNQVGTGLSYWPTRLHSLVELVPWNRFLGSLKV